MAQTDCKLFVLQFETGFGTVITPVLSTNTQSKDTLGYCGNVALEGWKNRAHNCPLAVLPIRRQHHRYHESNQIEPMVWVMARKREK
jgi:hypothetical protein